MTDRSRALAYHSEKHGKIEVRGKVRLESDEDLELAYTPGVAEPVREIADDPDEAYEYTAKGDMVAIASDGSSVLGLGNVGPEAAIPVIEGKALLLRELADHSAFPVLVDEQDEDSLLTTLKRLHPMFGFMMLEDIASPKCFHIEEELKRKLGIPVFHDDQHGAAIAVLAGLKNALRVVEKDLEEVSVTVIGAGAAGTGTAELLMDAGCTDITVVDRHGIIAPDMEELNWRQQELAEDINPEAVHGSLEDAMEGADVVVGLSVGGIVSEEMVRSMAEDPVVFALANPEPEIMPARADAAGAAVVATGRADFGNQINNSLVFPGIAKGAMSCYATEVNTQMKLAAADALAGLVDEPTADRIIPEALDPAIVDVVARAVTETASETGACRIDV